ncbi:unnamed protein product, partial [Pylaiella littoralis]
MSTAAVTAGASPLNNNRTLASFKCTKPGMRGGPNVVDQSKIILADGSPFTNLSLLQATERLAPLAGSWGNQTEMSALAAMAAAVTASDAIIGTAAFKKAAGPRAMLLWGLE